MNVKSISGHFSHKTHKKLQVQLSHNLFQNAFTQPFVISKDAFEFIGNLPSEIEQE